MRCRFAVSIAGLAVVFAACNDRPPTTSPTRTTRGMSFTISDAANNNGNPNFFFLPPLVTNPNQSATWRNGSFNPNLVPVVRVFLLTAGASECSITDAPVYGPTPMLLEPTSEQYTLNWDTKASPLSPGVPYRLCVYGTPADGALLLGFVDIQPVAGGVKKVATEDVYGFQDDRTLPIKVRLQNGALSATECPDPAQCTEATVTGAVPGSAGDTAKVIVIPSGYAALSLPPGAVKDGETVTIVIEKQAPQYPGDGTEQCLPTGLTQSKGCWRFSSEPAGYDFQQDVKVEFCVDAEPVPVERRNDLRVFKYNTSTGLEEWPWVDPTDITCDLQFTALGNAAGRAPASFASAALRQLGKWAGGLLLPRSLYAYRRGGVPKGVGGTGGSFSDFGGAVPTPAASLEINAGYYQSATVGTAVPIPPSVLVRDANGNPASGASVTFVPNSAGSVVAPAAPILTGSDGIATVTSWTLGTQAGTGDTLFATVAGLDGWFVYFVGWATPAAASRIAAHAGSAQTATAGTAVAIPPAVIVTDVYGNWIEGTFVTFAVQGGGGTVVPTVAVATRFDGTAAVTSWTLGPSPGANTLAATAPGLTGSPVTFTATATAPAPLIALSPSSASFEAIGVVSPTPKTVAVTNGGTGTLSGLGIGTISYGPGASGWLTASVSPTTAPATVTLTPTLGSLTPGTYTAAVPVTSTAGGVTNSPQNINVTFTVWPLPVIATDSLLPAAVVGNSYLVQLTGTGGNGSYSWIFSGVGQLPPGLSISSTGWLSGAPTTAGNYQFLVSMQSAGFGVQKWLGMRVQ